MYITKNLIPRKTTRIFFNGVSDKNYKLLTFFLKKGKIDKWVTTSQYYWNNIYRETRFGSQGKSRY